MLQEVLKQRKRDRGLVVEVELTPDLSAEGEASFAGLMDAFLKGARRERDSMGRRSEAVMVRMLCSSSCWQPGRVFGCSGCAASSLAASLQLLDLVRCTAG